MKIAVATTKITVSQRSATHKTLSREHSVVFNTLQRVEQHRAGAVKSRQQFVRVVGRAAIWMMLLNENSPGLLNDCVFSGRRNLQKVVVRFVHYLGLYSVTHVEG